MKSQVFSLHPFPGAGTLPDLQISGRIGRQAERLSLSYLLRGDLAAVLLPVPTATPARRDQLWERTCFECFLGVKQTQGYWEFNLSPTGDWNVYCFQGYRQGMSRELSLNSLPVQTQHLGNQFCLSLEIDLARLHRGAIAGIGGATPAGQESAAVLAQLPLEVGITAVIQAAAGDLSYWALTHCGPEPDFHRRESFSLQL